MTTRADIIQKLNELSSHEDFLEVMLLLCHKNLNCYAEDLASRDLRAVLNENEITFLFGLWLKNRKCKLKNFESIESRAKEVHRLMDELHITFIPSFSVFESSNSYHESSRNNPDVIKETIFYAGSGAYDYQFSHFLGQKYQLDKKWLESKKGFYLNDAKKLFIYIKAIITIKINKRKTSNIFDNYSISFNNYIFKKHPTFLKILDLLSFDTSDNLNSKFNDIGDLNEFKFRPVLKESNKYIIPLPYLLAEAIYDCPFYWMLEDSTYKSSALKNRGDSAEMIVKNILEQKISPEHVFNGVEIKKSKEITLSDVDVCVVDKNKMLVFQVKSKRLTQISKKGNIEQFQKDFGQSVQDAYKQTIIAKDAILSKNYAFIVKDTNKHLDLSDVNEIYSVCVVLDSYPSITTHTRMFFYDENSVLPITMSIFDLDVIMAYVQNFDMLFDYIKKRTINSKYFIADNELCFFSNYLKMGLERMPNSDITALDTNFAQYFDHYFYLPLSQQNERYFPDLLKGIERNDFCFCGSGIKYKNCCG